MDVDGTNLNWSLEELQFKKKQQLLFSVQFAAFS